MRTSHASGQGGARLAALTLAAAARESEPWPTFFTASVPNWARTLRGASFLAAEESVGPRSLRQMDTASSPISSRATTGPEDTNCTRLLRDGPTARHETGGFHGNTVPLDHV